MGKRALHYGFYIYYRTSAQSNGELRKRIDILQKGVAEETGITGRLLSKADDPLLWMEVYEGIIDRNAFESVLQRLCDKLRLNELCPDYARKTEIFTEPA